MLFGATGDLARRKLLPGLMHLARCGLMPDYRIVGTSLERIDDDAFRVVVREACEEFSRHPISLREWDDFARRLTFVAAGDGPEALATAVAQRRRGRSAAMPRRLHYLSVPPSAATAVVATLREADLVDRARIVMEKPFGTDLESAERLNATVHGVFAEEQVFRIDHFLGKEAAQNILALRFANGLFEPIWNRQHIEHVQIDVPETLAIGTRGGFYEQTGAYRDMVVTHLMQVLAFMAMEPPTALEPGADQRGEEQGLPVAAADRRAQRGARPVRGLPIGGRASPRTPRPRPSSRCAARSTTGAGRACRSSCEPARAWPTGRGSSRSRSGSRRAAMFPAGSGIGQFGPDHLTFDLAEASRLSLSFYGKRPGPGMKLTSRACSSRCTRTTDGGDVLEAYERLIHDAMVGDRTLFSTADGHRAALAGVDTAARRSAPGRDLPRRVVGPGQRARPHRPAWMADAVRAAVAGSALGRVRLTGQGVARPPNMRAWASPSPSNATAAATCRAASAAPSCTGAWKARTRRPRRQADVRGRRRRPQGHGRRPQPLRRRHASRPGRAHARRPASSAARTVPIGDACAERRSRW